MVRMIPDTLRSDTKSPAERRLYGIFRDGLPAGVTVLHSIPWQVRDQQSGARDGEADFIIVVPNAGVLVIEVKGGKIRYDGALGKWFSNEFEIKDPFEQAKTAKHSLLSLLREQAFWRSRWLTLGHAVAFPDVVVSDRSLRPDAPREIVLDARDLGRIDDWVRQALQYWGGQDYRDRAPGQDGATELIKLLSPSLMLRPLLSTAIDGEKQEFLRLTEQQFAILDFLGRHRRAAIGGCAGSGKTMLAVEKARRLNQQGFKVLLTCYNRNLAEFLAVSFEGQPGITTMNFHRLCTEFARMAEVAVPPHSNDDAFFRDVLPQILVEASDRLRNRDRFDAIIVDEGQDFHENYWIALEYLLRDYNKGILYVFYDGNQALYSPDFRLPISDQPFPLTKNLRNTQRIHSFVSLFYRGDEQITAIGPSGRAIELIAYSDTGQLKKLITRQLHRLINEEQVAIEDISILSPRSREHTALRLSERYGSFSLSEQPFLNNEVLWCTIYQFKGLESPVVILAELDLDHQDDLRRLLYVGASRAQSHLILLVQEAMFEAIRQFLKQ